MHLVKNSVKKSGSLLLNYERGVIFKEIKRIMNCGDRSACYYTNKDTLDDYG